MLTLASSDQVPIGVVFNKISSFPSIILGPQPTVLQPRPNPAMFGTNSGINTILSTLSMLFAMVDTLKKNTVPAYILLNADLLFLQEWGVAKYQEYSAGRVGQSGTPVTQTDGFFRFYSQGFAFTTPGLVMGTLDTFNTLPDVGRVVKEAIESNMANIRSNKFKVPKTDTSAWNSSYEDWRKYLMLCLPTIDPQNIKVILQRALLRDLTSGSMRATGYFIRLQIPIKIDSITWTFIGIPHIYIPIEVESTTYLFSTDTRPPIQIQIA